MSKSKNIKYFAFVFALAFLPVSVSMAQYQDLNLWTEVSIEKKIVKNVKLELELGQRLKNNFRQRDESLIDIGASYKFKDFSFSFIYRFSNKNKKNDSYTLANRFTYQLNYKKDIKRFTGNIRFRYQNQYEDFYSSENGALGENYFRSRFKIKYNIKGIPVDPYFSYELFTGANNDNKGIPQKQRIKIGANYKINKNNILGLGFFKQSDINKIKPTDYYVFNVSYKIAL